MLTRTLDTLHAQGEQITRTHNMAVDMDKDLSKNKPSKVNQYSRRRKREVGLAPKGRSAFYNTAS
ncbi:hypothetical protein NC652_026041 [Populus alba x Populus x berolinensis]|nr:hypothetical protein NC652_026041 [Populus alba x Populus x berolinensis]